MYDKEIKVFKNLENLPYIKNVFDTVYKDWKWSGPYCPGKRGHLTFSLEKDGVKKFIHFLDTDYSIYYED